MGLFGTMPPLAMTGAVPERNPRFWERGGRLGPGSVGLGRLSDNMTGIGMGLLSQRPGEGWGAALGRGFGFAQQNVRQSTMDQYMAEDREFAEDERAYLDRMRANEDNLRRIFTDAREGLDQNDPLAAQQAMIFDIAAGSRNPGAAIMPSILQDRSLAGAMARSQAGRGEWDRRRGLTEIDKKAAMWEKRGYDEDRLEDRQARDDDIRRQQQEFQTSEAINAHQRRVAEYDRTNDIRIRNAVTVSEKRELARQAYYSWKQEPEQMSEKDKADHRAFGLMMTEEDDGKFLDLWSRVDLIKAFRNVSIRESLEDLGGMEDNTLPTDDAYPLGAPPG